MSAADLSERAGELLVWICDVEADPARAAMLLSGITIAEGAIAAGKAHDQHDFLVLSHELRAAGMIGWEQARHDQ